MHNLIVCLFAVGAGMTAAGLISNIYRLLAREPSTKLGTLIHYAVMVIAGPAVLAGNSTRSFRNKECSKTAYALALVFSLYWCFATGLFILSLVVALHGA
jgi:phosphopantothenoylcysteine synthetase/decarboxylase